MQYLIKNSPQEPLQKLLAYANSLGVEVVPYPTFAQSIYQEAFQKAKELLQELSFDNTWQIEELVFDILTNLQNLGTENLFITRSGQGELIIYTQKDNILKNLLIDEDANIEFFYLDNQDRRNSYNKLFFAEDNYQLSEIVSLLL